MIKLLLGGSPCTYWSIAKSNNREVIPSGQGWELFKNYLIAKEKFKPDFFLYENNVSAAKPIKEEIKKELNVEEGSDARYIEINSALVSAQSRKRFYVHNCGNVELPKDRGILLRDILETGMPWQDKAYCLTARYGGAIIDNTLKRKQRTMVAEPIRIGDIGSTAQAQRVYSCDGKSVTLSAGGGGQGGKTGLYACPFEQMKVNEATKQGYAEIHLGDCVDLSNENSKTRRGRSMSKKANCLTTSHGFYQYLENIEKPIYEVKDGMITVNGKTYLIKLKDGYYIIRKLSITECCRLQTLPDNYCRAVSKAQAYKGLGNGWTAEVIIHILNNALANVPKDEEIVVLSMYDGIGTGRYCLDKMGFKNVKYYSFEIDKYAKQIAMSNYPDIIQCGDAFQVRDDSFVGYESLCEFEDKKVS